MALMLARQGFARSSAGGYLLVQARRVCIRDGGTYLHVLNLSVSRRTPFAVHCLTLSAQMINPYKRRGLLVSWLRLPLTLLQIQTERPADAAEIVRYLKSRRSGYLRSQPMKIVIAALQRRASSAPASFSRYTQPSPVTAA